jgi:hypothetical protein
MERIRECVTVNDCFCAVSVGVPPDPANPNVQVPAPSMMTVQDIKDGKIGNFGFAFCPSCGHEFTEEDFAVFDDDEEEYENGTKEFDDDPEEDEEPPADDSGVGQPPADAG